MGGNAELIGLLKGLPRPETDEYFLLLTLLASTRGTCGRRRVGCVLTDVHNHVISTGYNGPASGRPHCIDVGCPGRDLPSGTGLEKCEALHAEENALIQCTRPNEIYTVYCTASPCIHCVRRLMNTGAMRLVFAEEYPHPQSKAEWLLKPNGQTTGRTWRHLPWDQPPSTDVTPGEQSGPGPFWLNRDTFDTATQSSKAEASAGSRTPSS